MNKRIRQFIQSISNKENIESVDIFIAITNKNKNNGKKTNRTNLVCIITTEKGEKDYLSTSSEKTIFTYHTYSSKWKYSDKSKLNIFTSIKAKTTVNGISINNDLVKADKQSLIKAIKEMNDTFPSNNLLSETSDKLDGFDDLYVCFLPIKGELESTNVMMSQFTTIVRFINPTASYKCHFTCGAIDNNIATIYYTMIPLKPNEEEKEAYKNKALFVEQLNFHPTLSKLTNNKTIATSSSFLFTSTGKLSKEDFIKITKEPHFIKSYATALARIAKRIEERKIKYSESYIVKDWNYIAEAPNDFRTRLSSYTNIPLMETFIVTDPIKECKIKLTETEPIEIKSSNNVCHIPTYYAIENNKPVKVICLDSYQIGNAYINMLDTTIRIKIGTIFPQYLHGLQAVHTPSYTNKRLKVKDTTAKIDDADVICLQNKDSIVPLPILKFDVIKVNMEIDYTDIITKPNFSYKTTGEFKKSFIAKTTNKLIPYLLFINNESSPKEIFNTIKSMIETGMSIDHLFHSMLLPYITNVNIIYKNINDPQIKEFLKSYLHIIEKVDKTENSLKDLASFVELHYNIKLESL